MALLDILKNSMAGRKPAAAPMAPAAQDLQNLMQTKTTGKAVTAPAGPATSNVAGQVAAQSAVATQDSQNLGTDLALNQIATQAGQQQQALDTQAASQASNTANARANILAEQSTAGQERNAKEESQQRRLTSTANAQTLELNNKYANAVQELASERGITENEIFSNFRQEVAKLGVEKSAAQLEQLGHTLAMSDQRYVDTIKQIGQESNLQDEITFKRTASTLAFQKDLDLLSKQFDMERLIGADEREFKRQLAQIDIDTALSMAAQARKEAAATQFISGAVNVGSAYMNNKQNVDSWFAGNAPQTAGPSYSTDSTPLGGTAGGPR